MKHFINSSFRRIALACAALMFVSSFAFASNNPIPGVDIIVKKKPGNITFHATSDSSGKFSTKELEPGVYALTLNFLRLPASRGCVISLAKDRGHLIMVNGKSWDSSKPILVEEETKIEITIVGKSGTIGGTITERINRPILDK